MRRNKNRRITGACGCCLVPFVILLIIFIATVVFTSVVWHATMPTGFDWQSPRHHHFDAYRSGYQQGNIVGGQYAARGQAEPSGEELGDLARREAERLHVTRDRNQWTRGFRDGFTRGFENSSKQAFFKITSTNPSC